MAPIFIFLLILASSVAVQGNTKIFDIRNYGAVGDGKKDNTQAFSKAWDDACQFFGEAIVYIPVEIYILNKVDFIGPCLGRPVFHIEGVIRAPYWIGNTNSWITFRYVDKLVMKGGGGGTLDGQGQLAWKLGCHKNFNCPVLPASLSLEFVKNSEIHHMRSINSKNTHISVFGCDNVNFTNIRLSAPAYSPNTDGIKIGSSTSIRITNTFIGTGDDCIAILSGSKYLHVSNVFCGPGHGISVGSLGRSPSEDHVTGLEVVNCTLSNTQNGIRIKTWESPYPSVASGFIFQDIYMKDVANPILIDQMYCPYPPCEDKNPSHVQIKDVIYRNIWGTSSTEIAVSLNCSRAVPCKNIIMQNINLASEMYGVSKSWCSYIDGRSYGHQRPPACL